VLRRPTTFATRLALLGGLALVVRIAYAIYQRRHIPFPFSDATKYTALANYIADGKWFTDAYAGNAQTADHSPLYPLYLSILALFRSSPTPEFDFVVWSCFLGVASVVVIGIAGREILSARLGLIAAGIAAIDPAMWVHDGLLLSESMAILMTSCIILFAYRLWRVPSIWNVVWLGVFCGLGTLSRSELALSVPLVLLPLALRATGADWKRRFTLLIVGGLFAGIVVAPWIIYNRGRFDEPVMLTTNFGRTMAAAKCNDAVKSNLIGAQSYGCLQRIETRNGIVPGYDESKADRIYRSEAWKYVREHPGATVKQVAASWARIFGVYQPFRPTTSKFVEATSGTVVALFALLSFYVLFPAAIAGGFYLHRRKVPVWPLASFGVMILFSVTLTFAQQRYRAVAEPSMVILTAVLIEEIIRRRRPSETAAEAEPETRALAEA
jgi:4-amino-4-deoxy-L-arabinose transferase-like glycosyltransferase